LFARLTLIARQRSVLAQRLVGVIADLKSERISVLVSEPDCTQSGRLVDKVCAIERGQISVMTTRDVALGEP
jgi:branched-chain amino acid transport system ATP-binding protein